jgi:hypothetical protein
MRVQMGTTVRNQISQVLHFRTRVGPWQVDDSQRIAAI